MFDKVTREIEKIRIYRDLNKSEKNLLSLLVNQKKRSITKLRDMYEKRFSKKILSYILKTINRLNKEGLVYEFKEGRVKFVRLSPFGIELLSQEKNLEIGKFNL